MSRTAPQLKAKLNDTTRAQLLQAMPSLKERAKTLLELIAGSYFIFADRPLEIEPKAAALLTPETRELIGRLRAALEAVSAWSAETTESAMRNFAEQNNLKLGAVAQPLRAALTGTHDVARHFRGFGGTGTGGMPGPAGRSGQPVSSCVQNRSPSDPPASILQCTGQ